MPPRFTPTVRQLQPFRRVPARRASAPRKTLARRALALAAVFALTAGIGVATGAIPSAGGEICGCFDKDSGRLRVIDKAKQQKCKTGEQALNWNQRGPKGVAGPQGPSGAPGALDLLPRDDTGRARLGADCATAWSRAAPHT